MKKKILGVILVTILLSILIILTGCGNDKKLEDSNSDNKQEEINENVSQDNVSDIVGTWYLNRNVRVSDSRYNSLKSLLGDSYGTDTLEINEDGTFSMSAGMVYNLKGKYKYEDNELSFYNIEDINIKNETSLRDIEENLKLEYLEYSGNKFFKMYLYDFSDFEGYLFYEKDPNERVGLYADDSVPEVQFKNSNDTNTSNSNTQSSSLQTNNVNNTKEEYIGTYKNNQGKKIEILVEDEGQLYLKSDNKKCTIEIKDSNSVGVMSISNISQVIENATTIYVYPKGVSFSLSDNPANYEEGETDSSRYRLFIKSNNKADDSSIYYKQ